MIRQILSAAFAILLLLAGLVPAVGPHAAQAETVRDDTVTLDLSLEKWVETDSATVTVIADLALRSGEFGAARAAVKADLAKLSSTAVWRLTGYDRLGDEAGLERWRIAAEARLASAELGGLSATVSALGEAGRSFRLGGIDFTPALAEREAALSDLRAEIYRATAAELDRLNSVYPDRGYRVAAIHFATGSIPRPLPAQMMRAEAASKPAAGANGAADTVAQKATLRASVRFAAEVRADD